MKKNLFILAVTGALLGSCTGSSVKKADIKDTKDSVSYVIGTDYGTGIAQQLKTFPGGMNAEEFLEAFVAGFKGEDAKITMEDSRTYIMSYVQEAQKAEGDTTVSTNDAQLDSVSYLLGTDYGSGISTQMEAFPGGMNSLAFLDAFVTSFNGDSARIKVADSRTFISKYVESAQAEASVAAIAENKKFLDENAKNDSIQTTESGLQYKVLKSGNGEKATAENTVKVHYTGKLVDGTVFDSSVERGTPATFGVTGVIPGWTEALQLMSVGDKWTLYIPSQLAYGANPPSQDIPANAVLIFDVELLEIVK